jgi:hypothetical protein
MVPRVMARVVGLWPISTRLCFADLLGRPDPDLTREQRWRFDADFLVREIERRAPQRATAQRELLAQSRTELAESLADLTDAQVVVEFMRWVAGLNDGHGSVEVVDENSALAASLPLQFQLFGEGVCVTAAHPAHAALLGARVVAFGDCPIGRVLNDVDPLVSRDNVYGAPEQAMQVMRRTAVLHAPGIVDAPDGVELELAYPDRRRRRLPVPACRRPGRGATRCRLLWAGPHITRHCRACPRCICAIARGRTGSSTWPTTILSTSSSTACATAPASHSPSSWIACWPSWMPMPCAGS